ncbi:MAG: hypothetical protein DMF93_10580 [Acidobacteria bacterium]|nr:MAG: hypothetical protein DMF93_10580 [Acidobacteriota bacterium]
MRSRSAVPAPRKTPTRARSTGLSSRPASASASPAARRPIRSLRERRRRSRGVDPASTASMSTSAATRLR